MKITNPECIVAGNCEVHQGCWYVDEDGDLYIGEEDGILKIECANYVDNDEINFNIMQVDVEIKIIPFK